jgi:hypothetical protein
MQSENKTRNETQDKLNQTSQHREWQRENSLTSPLDRNPEVKFKLDGNIPLTEQETALATSELHDSVYISKYPQLEKRYVDPPVQGQQFCLISFVPSKTATPDSQGVYGFVKVRGSYSDIEDADKRAEELIRYTDSYHKIYTAFVGRPFPLTLSSDYSEKVNSIDIKKKVIETVSEDVKKKRMEEQKEIQEIQEREKALLEDVKKAPEENKEDYYTTLMTKKAQLSWLYLETEKKLVDMRGNICKTRHELKELDALDTTFREKYYDKYMNARRQAGLSTDKDSVDCGFMKFLVEDAVIPAVDREYELMYGKEEKGEIQDLKTETKN